MSVLFYGLTAFFLAFLIHLLMWKIRIPKKHMLVLFWIFTGAFVAVIFISRIFPGFSLLGIIVSSSPAELEYSALLYFSLTLAYIISYSAVQAESPTVTIILDIAAAGKSGLQKQKLFSQMSDEILIIPRIKDLLNSKMIYIEGDKYKITPCAILLTGIFALYRKLLNAQKGG